MARAVRAPDSDLAVAEAQAVPERVEAVELVAPAVLGAAQVVLACGILQGPAAVATAKALVRVHLVPEAPGAGELEAAVVSVGVGPVVAEEPGVGVQEPGGALVVQVARAEQGPVAGELRLPVVSMRLQENG